MEAGSNAPQVERPREDPRGSRGARPRAVPRRGLDLRSGDRPGADGEPDERAWSILDSYRVEGAEEQMLEQRETTDRALDKRDRAFEALNTSALDQRVRDAID